MTTTEHVQFTSIYHVHTTHMFTNHGPRWCEKAGGELCVSVEGLTAGVCLCVYVCVSAACDEM